jgi:lipopolysaccharide transport system permease protein
MTWFPPYTLFAEHKDLIFQLARREVLERYRGSALGLVWSFMHPVLMLLVYMFVFGIVFSMKWGIEQRGGLEFAIILFSGLVIHGLFAECMVRAPTLVVNHPHFVKKIVFPLQILPLVSVCVALFHTAVGLLILLLAVLLTQASIPPTILLLPVVLFPIVVLALGVSWFLASLGVFLRDVTQVVGILATVLLFLSPIFYPVTAVPEYLQPFLYLNPLTLIIEELRNVMVFGNAPDLVALGIYFVLAYAFMMFAVWWFSRTRNAFADVL